MATTFSRTFEAEADERAGLKLLEPRDRSDVERHFFGGEIHHLAAGHARGTGRAGEFRDELRPDERILVRRLGGQHLKGERVERVSGENGGAFVVSAVDGRLATPEVVIVHAGQVVMDQRVDVDAFDGEAHAKRTLPVDMEEAAAGDDEQRAKPLAATDRSIAHGFVQACARVFRDRQQRTEQAVDIGGDAVERRLEADKCVHVQSPSKGAVPAGWPSRPSWIFSIRAWAACSRASHCCFNRSPSA